MCFFCANIFFFISYWIFFWRSLTVLNKINIKIRQYLVSRHKRKTLTKGHLLRADQLKLKKKVAGYSRSRKNIDIYMKESNISRQQNKIKSKNEKVKISNEKICLFNLTWNLISPSLLFFPFLYVLSWHSKSQKWGIYMKRHTCFK